MPALIGVKTGSGAMAARWEHFPHGADVGVRGIGPTPAAAFAEAARALTAVVADLGTIEPMATVGIRCDAHDREELLYAWLNAVVYEMATRRMLFREFAVTIADNALRATARGESVQPAKHAPAVEVKGATYTALSVRQTGDEWVAECVVDV